MLGSVHERGLCGQKPGPMPLRVCHSDGAHYRATLLPGDLKANQCSRPKKICANWNEVEMREHLTICAEALDIDTYILMKIKILIQIS